MLRIDTIKKARARKQAGFIVTGELLLIAVVLVIGLVTGMTKLRDQAISELGDTGDAIGAINQSYSVTGTNWTSGATIVAQESGFAFQDTSDPYTNGKVGGDVNEPIYLASPTPSSEGNGLSEDTGTGGINGGGLP